MGAGVSRAARENKAASAATRAVVQLGPGSCGPVHKRIAKALKVRNTTELAKILVSVPVSPLSRPGPLANLCMPRPSSTRVFRLPSWVSGGAVVVPIWPPCRAGFAFSWVGCGFLSGFGMAPAGVSYGPVDTLHSSGTE